MRSGSASSAFTAYPLGQMKPWLKTSASSPRMPTISRPRVVISRPQVASQSGQTW